MESIFSWVLKRELSKAVRHFPLQIQYHSMTRKISHLDQTSIIVDSHCLYKSKVYFKENYVLHVIEIIAKIWKHISINSKT